MSAVKILAVVVVTAAVTLLCIRSGQALAKSAAGTVYRAMDGGGPEDRGKLLTVAAAAAAATAATDATVAADVTTMPDAIADVQVESNGTEMVPNRNGTEPKRNRMEPHRNGTEPNGNGTEPNGNGTAAVEQAQATSRSLNDRFITSLTPRKLERPAFVRGKWPKTRPTAINRQNGDGEAKGYEENGDDDDVGSGGDVKGADIVVDAGVYGTKTGPHYRQMSHVRDGGYSTIDADISVAEEDGSAGYHDSYNAYAENSNDGAGWNRPGPSAEGTGGLGRPPYGAAGPSFSYPYPASIANQMVKQLHRPTNVYGYPPSGYPAAGYHQQASPGYQQHQQTSGHFNVHSPFQQIQMIYEKIDWHKVGILALFKIGVAKLKAFGFLKVLFLLVFKLKLFLIAMFFKFLLVLKLMKFFKLLMIPLILLTLLPIISSLASPMLVGGLLSIPSRIIDYLTGPVYAPATAATKYSATVVSADPTILPSVTAAKAGSLSSSSSTPSKSDEINLSDRRRLDTIESFDPTMNIFRKVLDSEKCVERIACRMAVVEKAGILPVWINWVLHRVSKLIPNEKLEHYLKTYDDVSNELYTKSENPDSWATWCLERYDCNGANSTTLTNVTDKTQ